MSLPIDAEVLAAAAEAPPIPESSLASVAAIWRTAIQGSNQKQRKTVASCANS